MNTIVDTRQNKLNSFDSMGIEKHFIFLSPSFMSALWNDFETHQPIPKQVKIDKHALANQTNMNEETDKHKESNLEEIATTKADPFVYIPATVKKKEKRKRKKERAFMFVCLFVFILFLSVFFFNFF